MSVDHPATAAKPVVYEFLQNPTLARPLDQFLTALRQSRLVEDSRLDVLLKKLQDRAAGRKVDGRHLCQVLLNARLLTPWQAEMLLRGESNRFFLSAYRLLSMLGRGGMGIVYLAEHTMMFRRVALKILPPDLVEDPTYLPRFYKESQTLAALDHPNVVRAYDVGCDGNIHFLVMEYVEGTDLEQIVQRDGALLPGQAAEYIRQAADGLAHAHEKGIIHRDIKPANLLLDRHGRVKVLDLGLARQSATGQSLTNEGMIVGTPDYMAPEQAIDSTKIDGRADLYSLGCTLYYLLTGKRPFTGRSYAEILLAHQIQMPVPIRDLRKGVPNFLIEVCERLLQKRPEDRFASASELSQKLGDWVNGLSKPPLPQRQQHHTANETVLVADDDESIRKLLDYQLTKAGYRVILAADGREAQQKMNPQISICLFDLQMPHANGLECLRFVQSSYPGTPVIIVSAIREVQEAITAMRDGAFDYIIKPCKISTVLSRVDDALQARARRQQELRLMRSVLDNTPRNEENPLDGLGKAAATTPNISDVESRHILKAIEDDKLG